MTNELVTVFRSADEDAQEQSARVADILKSAGIETAVLDDSAPGVPEGAWEVQVPAADSSRADALLAANPEPQPDESHELDLVTVFESGDGTAEGDIEAMTVKNLLEAAGIQSVLIGDVPIPSLGPEVRVSRDLAEEARRVISEARVSGAAAADEAEAESEVSN